MTTTRVALITPTPPYYAEGNTPQMGTVIGTALTNAATTYLVSLKYGPVHCLFFSTEFVTVSIPSFATPYGRLDDISQQFTGFSPYFSRIFNRVGWGNEDGDLEITVDMTGATLLPFAIQN